MIKDDLAKLDEIFSKFEEAMDLGEGVSMDYYLKDVNYSVAEAKTALTQLLLEARISEVNLIDDKIYDISSTDLSTPTEAIREIIQTRLKSLIAELLGTNQ